MPCHCSDHTGAHLTSTLIPVSSSFNALLRYARGQHEWEDAPADAAQTTCANTTDCVSQRSPLDLPLSRQHWIDSRVSSDKTTPQVCWLPLFAERSLLKRGVAQVRNGVKVGEGDGTVSLISLGAMCVEGWKRKNWNPAGIKVVTVEVCY